MTALLRLFYVLVALADNTVCWLIARLLSTGLYDQEVLERQVVVTAEQLTRTAVTA